MSETNKKNKRQQLSRSVGLGISHARVRKYLSEYGINQGTKEKVQDLTDRIEEIKKRGAPELGSKPEKPVKPKKDDFKDDNDAYEAALEEHTAALEEFKTLKEEYDAEASVYGKYVSDEYNHLRVAHAVAKNLGKISETLQRKAEAVAENNKGFSESGQKDLAKMQNAFSAAPKKYGNEKAEAFNSRATIHKEIMTFLGKVDVNDKKSVDSALKRLLSKYPDLSIFLEKDELSRSNFRINDPATIAVAAVLESGIEELAEHAMEQVIKKDMKMIYPEHVVSDGVENCPLYMLFESLPHWIAIEERQQRKAQWEEDSKAHRQETIAKAKAIAKKRGKKYETPPNTFPSFGDHENEAGHCEKTTTTTTDSEGKTVKKSTYKWYGIDIERSDDHDEEDDDDDEESEHSNEHGPSFKFYVTNLCKHVKESKVDEGFYDHDKIRISEGIAHFFSNLMIDFIRRICPLIKTSIEYKKSATITEETVKFVLTFMLLDSREKVDGSVKLREEHEALLDFIDSKVKQVRARQTDAKAAHADGEEIDAEDLEADDNEEDIVDDEPSTAPAPAKRAGRRRPAGRK